MCSQYLSPTEHKVLWSIIAKIWRWHKEKERIIYSEFERLTGVHRRKLAPALKWLKQLQIIVKTGGGMKLYYGIEKDCRKWKTLPKRMAPNPLSKRTHTKENKEK